MSNSNIKFWSLADKAHVDVPASECKLETVKTTKGERRRVTASIQTNPGGKVRKLSKFVAKDFTL